MSSQGELGPPGGEHHGGEPQHSTLSLLNMRGPDGPFFMRGDGTPIAGPSLRIMAKVDGSSEETVFKLMQELEVLPFDEGDTGIVVSAICEAAAEYRGRYVTSVFDKARHKALMRELTDSTKHLNDLPLLQAACDMHTHFRNARNEEVEAIVRILFAYESGLEQNPPRQTSQILP